ncbi:MAG: SGNH/GDSL hydrolase family protein [Polyangiaceae bacterium]|nr:SGNH/GDSL hydrolase family protein [Polyangiaceae bacterium]
MRRSIFALASPYAHRLVCASVAVLFAVGFVAIFPVSSAADQVPLPPDAPVVLHAGDSFVHVGFTQTLAPKFKASGVRYVVRAQHSLYIPTISRALQLPDLMRQYKPSLVILNIGGNEMQMPKPSDHAPAVRRLSAVVSAGGASCVWVTPPPPAHGETGIIGEILRESTPCRVYDSRPIAPSLDREKHDKVHPTRPAGAKWAEAFWVWLEQERESGSSWKLKPRPELVPSSEAPPATSAPAPTTSAPGASR